MTNPYSAVPFGLEPLAQVDQLMVRQQLEWLEILGCCETNNKYKIKSAAGLDLFMADENNDCCTLCFCGTLRPFEMTIVDLAGNEVLRMERPLRCKSCWYPCCLQLLVVTGPDGAHFGSVQQEWSICNPQFSVRDQSGEVVLLIQGPICTFSIFCGDLEFNVLSADGSVQVGVISKHWSGLLKEAFTDADNFGITIPLNLDVRMKATLLGVLFLIDFMFFEKTRGKDSDTAPGMTD